MPSVAEFLIERLGNSGIKHIFGVPGDYLSEFIGHLSQNEKIKFVSNTDENHAGFAADAYARANGIGCVIGPASTVMLRIDSQYRQGNLYLSAAGDTGTGNVYVTPGVI
jgi:glyoxylate carboligase